MQISEHQVRECAYYIWENEGRVHGQAAAHWLRAEAALHADVHAAVATVSPATDAKVAAKAAVAKAAAPKVAAPKVAAPKVAAAKVAAPKAAAKPAAPAPVKAAAKPAAPKPVRASKAAVTAGLAAKAKPARAPAAMH